MQTSCRHFINTRSLRAFVLVLTSFLAACSDDAKLQPLNEAATVLAFGDSLTYGTGTNRASAYPAILQSMIKHDVINAGVPGEISRLGVARLPALLERYQPELVILCHGGNDILRKLDLSQTEQNLQQMIDAAHAHGAQVVLIGVPEFGLFLKAAPLYQRLADKNKLPVENDILGNILGKNTLKSDHIHPNTKGYQLLAESIWTLLSDAGAL